MISGKVFTMKMNYALMAVGLVILASVQSDAWTVQVINYTKDPIPLHCASKDDRIGDDDTIVLPGDSLSWSFGVGFRTQFWCTTYVNGKKAGWDVFVYNWRDAPNPTVWYIYDFGIVDAWAHRLWRTF